MSKNSMISGLAINQITLDYAFNNLLLVANVINSRNDCRDLLRWVEHEISGYKETDIIPSYRKDEKSTQFMYSMVNNGYTTTNLPLPFSYFSEELQSEVIYFDILEGIKTIEKMLHSKEQWFLTKDCTIHAPDIYKNSGVHCLSIYQILPKASYERFYSAVKLNLTKVLLLIERHFGTLDSAEMQNKKYDKNKLEAAKREIAEYINSMYADNSKPRAKEIKKPANEKQDISLQKQAQQVQQQPAQQIQQQPAQQMPMQQMQHMPMQQPMMQQPMMQQMQYYTQMPAQPVMPQIPRQSVPVNQAPIISNEQQYAETIIPTNSQVNEDDLVKPEINELNQKIDNVKEPDRFEEITLKSSAKESEMDGKKLDEIENKIVGETKAVIIEEPNEKLIETPKEEPVMQEVQESAIQEPLHEPELKQASKPEQSAGAKKEKPTDSGIFARISGLKK